MLSIRHFESLDKTKQIQVLEDCIKELKDDDINKIILENKLNSITNTTKTAYRKKEYKDIFKVNQ
jgi:hypothetical protein